MKSILKNAVVGVMSLGLTATVLPAQDNHQDMPRGGAVQTAAWHDDGHYRDQRYDRRDAQPYDGYRNNWVGQDRYYVDRDHHGRDAAVVVGSAAGGALIGAAVDHGRGAAIGAIVGGVGGLIADEAIRHGEYRR